MRAVPLVLALVLMPAIPASAEWQIKPFVGATFARSSTYVLDSAESSGNRHLAVGLDGMLLGEVFGIEVDACHASRFFQSAQSLLIAGSSVTTVTGNVVVAVPRRWTQYTLRPYFVGGGGLLRARIDDVLAVLPVSSNMPAWDMGAGVTGFLTDRFGVSWDVRYFHSVGGSQSGPATLGPEQLSFWRANMALAIRY